MMDFTKRSPERLFEGILLLSDLDGTLLNRKKQIVERNLEAIRRFQEKGGLFSIATGRCSCSAQTIASVTGVNCPGVTLNGAVVYDFNQGRPARQSYLPEWYREIAWDVHEHFPSIGVQTYVGSDVQVVQSNDVMVRLHEIERTESCCEDVPFDRLPAQVNKVLFGGAHEELHKVRRFLEGRLDGMYGMFTEETYYELLPARANKGMGLKMVAEVCGIAPSCVAAVGDYYNDVDMLKAAAYPMAAGNAPEDVKILARFIAGDCEDGVVADAIEHLEQRLTERGRLQGCKK